MQEAEAEGVREFIKDMDGSKEVVLELTEAKVKILKADVKERKGEFTLIFRYQLV